GDDIISGLDGADVIHGLAGNDQIDGGGWNDEIYGGDDNDTIFGDWGHDFIEGGPGNDDMDGGVGYDIVSYRSAPSGITIDLRLSTPQDTGGAGIDTIVNFRAVRGSDYGDVITGDDTQNDLLGFDGDDTITGLRGNDTIHGGAGYDTAVFSGYYAQYTLTDFGDYITIEDRFGTDGTDVLYGIEALQFSDGTFAPFDPLPAGSPIFGYTTNDTINGDNNDNLIYGLWGIDTIHGLGGSDTIYGGEQGDLIFGDEGNDFLYGFHGSDIMDGGPGDDLIDGQSGFNTASYQSATSGVTVDLSIIGPQDTIGAGVDTLVQMKGLIGSDYADILYGNVLLNHIDGGAGDDWIAPGKADDIITGGAGADTIYLHADDVRWGFNTITDFNPGEGDALDIADVLFGYDALTNAITDFVTVTDNGVDSTVIVDQDGSGTQYAAKTIAVLQNITGLSDVEGLETAGTLITV
ncbi:MAG: calcium-binding protein, partial [Alphaproteobacteria bacterium]|nr:calcium-binding protein [Alphaproteobacteria bacterium]